MIAQKVREKLGDSKGAQEASTPSSQPSTTVVSAGTVSEPVSSAPPVFPSAYPMVPSQPSKQPQVVVTSAVGAPSVLLPMARQASMLNYMSLRQQQQPVPNQVYSGDINGRGLGLRALQLNCDHLCVVSSNNQRNGRVFCFFGYNLLFWLSQPRSSCWLLLAKELT